MEVITVENKQSHLKMGDILQDRYCIVSLIGQGGSGSVYLAQDLRLEGKYWAIKETLVDDAVSKQIIAEAKILAQLDHPCLPQVVDWFTLPSHGYLYLVRDYIRGMTLLELFESEGRTLPYEQIIDYAIQICDVLHYLHSQPNQPIIYRDLKPANVIINENDDIKLIDFGIARVYKTDQHEDTVQIGTIGFAAPEQFENVQTDERSDLFSLGAMMYFLLSGGRYIYSTHNPLEHLKGDTPKKLIECIHILIQKNPDQRYQSALEVKNVLMDILGNHQRKNRLHSSILFRKKTGYGSDVVNPFPMKEKIIISERIVGTIIVSIIGVEGNVGTTHLSIVLANYLARMGHEVAVVEANNSNDLQEIERAYEGKNFNSLTQSFMINGVHYFKSNADFDIPLLLSKGYNFILLDLGAYENNKLLNEFLRSHVQIVVAQGSEWKQKKLYDFVHMYHDQSNRWRICIPCSNDMMRDDIKKQIKGTNVYGIPLHPDPYKTQKDSDSVLKNILGEFNPKRKAKISFLKLVSLFGVGILSISAILLLYALLD